MLVQAGRLESSRSDDDFVNRVQDGGRWSRSASLMIMRTSLSGIWRTYSQ